MAYTYQPLPLPLLLIRPLYNGLRHEHYWHNIGIINTHTIATIIGIISIVNVNNVTLSY